MCVALLRAGAGGEYPPPRCSTLHRRRAVPVLQRILHLPLRHQSLLITSGGGAEAIFAPTTHLITLESDPAGLLGVALLHKLGDGEQPEEGDEHKGTGEGALGVCVTGGDELGEEVEARGLDTANFLPLLVGGDGSVLIW